METVLLGWPPAGPTLRLDYRRFSYAGKFVMSTTGKAVVRTAGADEATDRDLTGDTSEPRTAREDSAKPTESNHFVDDVVAAIAFNADRTDPKTLWIRYVSVRDDRRGEGLGAGLCRFLVERAADRGYQRLKIAVNNPFAYEALYRAGFAFTGEETGLAELVLARPADEPANDRSQRTYQSGLDRYRKRELSEHERAFLDEKCETSLPDLI